jgi:hypothetical protein
MLAPVELELQTASAKCREALNAPEFQLLDAVLDGPGDAQDWFDLFSRYDTDPDAYAKLRKMKAALPAELATAGVKIEHYVALQALSVAASRIGSMSLPQTIKRYYATFCTEIAERERQWESHYNMEGDPDRFIDIVHLATLRRFPLGALNYGYENVAALRTMFFIHPFSAPGYLYKRLISMPFAKPTFAPHLNYGRKGSLVLSRTDYEQSLWLLAKSVEMHPKVSGINGWSWFYSQLVGETYPHLAWMRDVLVDGGAYLIDTFPAEPGGYGFAYNNRKRQILYDQGRFCPRQTVFFWSRNDFLDWASRHPELIPEGEEPVRAPLRHALIQIKSPKPARHAKHNSSITLWNGKAVLDRIGGLKYLGLVLILPALMLALSAFFISGPWLAFLTFPIAVFLFFSFQYFCSQ